MDRVFQTVSGTYSRAGDVSVMALCFVMVVLLTSSYVSRTRSYRIFALSIAVLFAAAFVNIGYHCLLDAGAEKYLAMTHVMRLLYVALIFGTFFLFALYLTEVSGMDRRRSRIVIISACLLTVLTAGTEILRVAGGTGWHLDAEGKVVYGNAVFMIGYILFIALLVAELGKIRHLLFRRVMYGIFGTMAISVLLMLGQLALNMSSLITMTFVFPVIAMMYIMHAHPYNVTLGAVDARSMEDWVRNMYRRGAPFAVVSLLLPESDRDGVKIPTEVRKLVRRFVGKYFRGAVLFQVSNGHVVLMAPKRQNFDFANRVRSFREEFQVQYERLRYPYKLVIGESIGEISRKNEYASLLRYVNGRIPDCTVHTLSAEDVERFNREEYILAELADIAAKRDPEDPRVLVYCQPVLSLKTGKFETAEALVRLRPEKGGILSPDMFIPMAEAHGYIHALTEIVLHKTCREIRRLTDGHYRIRRISVNISSQELKDDAFCGDINRIIERNGVLGEKIAVELTESSTEEDFMRMKRKIEELQREGIKFYLDDFGTGYSNMERIMALPFDIIKFDRSLVTAGRSDDRSARLVENMAHMFRDMDYDVLYEGIEDEKDEEKYGRLSAVYMQGYRYSRPVPIERLRDFLEKERSGTETEEGQ